PDDNGNPKPGTITPDQKPEVKPDDNGNPKPGTITPDQKPDTDQKPGTNQKPGNGQTGGDTDNTDSDNKQTIVNDEVKTSNGPKDKSELPETGLSDESDYATTVFGTISLAASLLLLRRQRKESK
ncbi:LPXTG cell wall anchor domain-containing protein, partial [Staphylococcus capitis]